MNTRQIAETLAPYGVDADATFCRQIETYIELLLAWNRKVSLTAIRQFEQIVRFHFGESLFAIRAVPVEKGRLADVGAGAGFPGIPLAMGRPELEVVLIEASQKKAAFLAEVVRTLGLKNVSIERQRLENVDASLCKFDFITARALGQREHLLEWSVDSIDDTGNLVLWVGQDDAQDIACISGWDWRDVIRIPLSLKRVLLVGSPRTG